MRISKSFCLISALLPLGLAASVARAAETVPDLPEKPAYVEMLRGDHYRDLGQGAKARGCYEAALTVFEKLHLEQPAYKPASIEFRTDYCRKQIKALKDSGVTESAPAESPAEAAAPAGADRALQEKNEALRREIESLKARFEATPAAALTADLEKVRVRHGGRLVAEHDRRWARGMTVTDPGHVHAAAVLRRAFQGRDLAPSGDPAEAMVRDLADYDRAFGLDAGGLP